MTRVKICGLTRPQDAAMAAGLGAWALGVIFAPESLRRVSLKQAAEVLKAGIEAAAEQRVELQEGIVREEGIQRVGVFVNEQAREIEEAVRACGLTAVQLHGEETPEFCAEVGRRTGVKVIKALRVSGEQLLAGVVQFDTDFVLLDTYFPERRGGTGRIFDWSLAAALPAHIRAGRVILSGGLCPENVADAVRAVAPYAVDLSSGVETAPGIKDREKMGSLFAVLHKLGQ